MHERNSTARGRPFVTILLCTLLTAPAATAQGQPLIYPGVGDPLEFSDAEALDMSAAPHGFFNNIFYPGGLLAIEDNGSGAQNLAFFFRPDLTQRITILQNRTIQGLSDRGFRSEPPEESYSLTVDLTLQLLTVNSGTGAFTLEEISSEEVFYESDLLVTPGGEAFVLAYDAISFRPRLFRKPAGGSWQELNLGLSGVYLGGIFGRPESALVPEIIDGQLYFWVVKQLNAAADQLVLISVPVGIGAALAPAGGTTVQERNIDQIRAPATSTPNQVEDTASISLGGRALLAFVTNDRVKMAAYDPDSNQSSVDVVDCPTGNRWSTSLLESTPGTFFSYTPDFASHFRSSEPFTHTGNLQLEMGFRTTGTDSEVSSGAFRPRPVTDGSQPPRLFGPDEHITQELFESHFGIRPRTTRRMTLLGHTKVIPQVITGASLMEVTNLENFGGAIDWSVYDPDGNRIDDGVMEVDPLSTFSFSISGPRLGSGYAILRSNLNFMVQTTWKLKEVIDSPDAGVAGQIGSRQWHVFARYDTTRQSGIAIANPNPQPNNCQLLLMQPGQPVIARSYVLTRGGQDAAFLNEFFRNVVADPPTVGRFDIDCEYPVSVTAVTQESDSGALVVTPAMPCKDDFEHLDMRRPLANQVSQ